MTDKQLSNAATHEIIASTATANQVEAAAIRRWADQPRVSRTRSYPYKVSAPRSNSVIARIARVFTRWC